MTDICIAKCVAVWNSWRTTGLSHHLCNQHSLWISWCFRKLEFHFIYITGSHSVVDWWWLGLYFWLMFPDGLPVEVVCGDARSCLPEHLPGLHLQLQLMGQRVHQVPWPHTGTTQSQYLVHDTRYSSITVDSHYSLVQFRSHWILRWFWTSV